jgi:hypothetical protein
MPQKLSITKEEFTAILDRSPQGNPDALWAELMGQSSLSGMSMKEIMDRWVSYIEMTAHQGREQKYIKSLSNFLKEGMYKAKFKYESPSIKIAKEWLKL